MKPEVREANTRDIPEMARLFAILGYDIAEDLLAERFAELSAAGEHALVFPDPEDAHALRGLATLHVTPVLHRAGPVGRVTALVVDTASRNQGIGRALMAAAERWLTERDCVLIEVTSNLRRTDAHAFYDRIGYERTSFRFAKPLA